MTYKQSILAIMCLSTAIGGSALADPTSAGNMTAPAPNAAVPAIGPHTLTVTVTGVRSARGNIRAQLSKADDTTGDPKFAGATIVKAVEGTTILTFAGLMDGDYGVQMFHDEDDDGVMKSNLFGIPSEGYAFSHGARASFGPPKFADMKVTVSASTATIANMAY